MSEFWTGFCLGWGCGAAAMWFHFWHSRLIRTRYEWYAERKARGISVPDDWEKPEENI